MFRSSVFAALPLFALALAGCEQLDTGQLYASKAAARLVVAECVLAPATRLSNLASVNDELSRRGAAARAIAVDCDGDGAADF